MMLYNLSLQVRRPSSGQLRLHCFVLHLPRMFRPMLATKSGEQPNYLNQNSLKMLEKEKFPILSSIVYFAHCLNFAFFKINHGTFFENSVSNRKRLLVSNFFSKNTVAFIQWSKLQVNVSLSILGQQTGIKIKISFLIDHHKVDFDIFKI